MKKQQEPIKVQIVSPITKEQLPLVIGSSLFILAFIVFPFLFPFSLIISPLFLIASLGFLVYYGIKKQNLTKDKIIERYKYIFSGWRLVLIILFLILVSIGFLAEIYL